ncbi:MAG: metallophosphoesterase [Spirochaetes bacterium]|nr:metallophosphoesterase [Spirochaetota bacterium]
MKTSNYIIFFTIVLTVYFSVNFYIFIRGWQVLPRGSILRAPYVILFLFLSLSFIAGRLLERLTICAASSALIWIGSFWLGLMLYLFLGALLCDLLRLGSLAFHVVPRESARYLAVKQAAAAIVAVLAFVAVFAGHLNTLHPRIKTVSVNVPKTGGGLGVLNIALVTDIHLGTIIKNSRLQKMVDMINSLRPDIVLLGGDIVDEDLAPVIKNNLGGLLGTIRSRYGTYAVTGNHEFIGGAGRACRYLGEHGVTMLRDRVLLVDNGFYLVGREDVSIAQFTGRKRATLEELMKGVDRSKPVILMDHQPLRLSSAVENGVDLQVSGHTHHGQLWPASLITGLIYRISHGYGRIGDTHFYVSSGYGTWGPPARVGTTPEVVHIQVRFAGDVKGPRQAIPAPRHPR